MRDFLLSSAARFAPEMGGTGNLNNVTSQNRQQTDTNKGAGNDTTAGNGGDDSGDSPENFFENNADLWEPPEVDPSTVEKPQTQEELDAAATKTQSRLQAYVASKSKVEIDATKFQEAIDNKDPKFMQEVINGAIQTAHKNMLEDAAKMVREMQTSMRQEMDNAAQNRLRADKAETSLITTLPFLADNAALKPIATAIKAQFLKKGADDKKANDMVRQFFKSTADLASDALDDVTNPPRNRDGSFNQPPRRRQVEEPDWAAIIGGRP